jgi:hypothetical protein
MANLKLKENLDLTPATISTTANGLKQGLNALPQSGFIMPYAGPTPLTTATGTSGTNTIVVASATGAFVGQGIYGTGLSNPGVGLMNYITGVSGTTITVAFPLTATISSGSVRFCPAGWLLCDGNNGTPDLRNDYVSGSTTPGNSTTGNHTHTVNTANTAVSSTTVAQEHSSTILAGTTTSYGANNAAHSHVYYFGRVTDTGSDANSNRITGNQANVVQNDHIHPNDAETNNAVSTSNSGNHNHATPNFGTAGGAVSTANHNHTRSPAASSAITATTANAPATFFVNWIMKV